MDLVQLSYMCDVRKDGEVSILGLTLGQLHLGDLTSDLTRSPRGYVAAVAHGSR